MQTHQAAELRDGLIRSLEEIYQLEAFGALAELLQGEALVLRDLAAHRGEAVYPSVLSQRLRLSRSRITGALNSLRRKGAIALVPSAEDRRMVQVSITEAGFDQISRQTARMTAYFDRMIQGLGTEDTRALIALMDRCVGVMERQTEGS